MNRQLLRLSVASIVLLGILVAATTYWQTWAVAGLQDRQDNAVQQVAQFTVARGLIEGSAQQTILAANRKKRVNGQTLYFRHYPQNGLAAQVVGYATTGSTAGLEQSLNDYLTGSNSNLSNVLRGTLDRLGGGTVHGDNVVLTLNVAAQRLALQQLGGRCGSVVAMNPRTGAILVMASSPTYDPNLLEQPNGYAKILKTKAPCRYPSPFLNRATAGLWPPGSTFKMVTASAALDTGTFQPSSHFYDPGYCVDYGKKVYNASAPDSPSAHETFGNTTLAAGFEHSINSVYCNVGEKLGAKTILDYAKRFGFYSVLPLETPVDERAASGLYESTKHGDKLWNPQDPNTQVDVGRLAFGQERMLATPLQMLLVAATIANGGVVPRPYIVQRIVGHDGSIVAQTQPQTLGRAIKPETAAELNQFMQLVVQGGTGTAAQIPGVAVAGKTGTAETGITNVYDAWFVCFAPADNPRVAVAVVVEDQLNGFGGSVSAPIAKAVMEQLLKG